MIYDQHVPVSRLKELVLAVKLPVPKGMIKRDRRWYIGFKVAGKKTLLSFSIRIDRPTDRGMENTESSSRRNLETEREWENGREWDGENESKIYKGEKWNPFHPLWKLFFSLFFFVCPFFNTWKTFFKILYKGYLLSPTRGPLLWSDSSFPSLHCPASLLPA